MTEIFGFVQTIFNNPFYLPLGIIGAWRWGIWLIKRLLAFLYRPEKEPYSASVSVVTPVYNEPPKVFKKALASWKRNNPDEIIAVIDQTDIKNIQGFKDFALHTSGAKLIITDIPGKRASLDQGIRSAKNEIVALVDSDTIWKPDVLKNALCPFNDPKIAGVGTRQNVLKPTTLAQKLFDIQLDQRYFEEHPFLSVAAGALTVLSGRTAIYRRRVLLPLLPQMVNETFFDEKVISGEDKRLTYLVQAADWKVAFQNSAQVLTPGEKSIPIFLKQRIRWTRNSWRSELRALSQSWTWKHPIFVIFLLDRIIQSFTVQLSLIYFVLFLAFGLWVSALALIIWWLVSRSIRITPHLIRRPADISVIPFFIMYQFINGFIRIYALFTFNTQGWITRWDKKRLPRFGFFREVPAYISTILVFFALTGIVFNHNLGIFRLEFTIQKERTQDITAFKPNQNSNPKLIFLGLESTDEIQTEECMKDAANLGKLDLEEIIAPLLSQKPC